MRQNWAEWAVLTISVIAVTGIVGFLLFDGLVDEARPPQPVIEIHVDAAYETATSWIVPATVINEGDEVAVGARPARDGDRRRRGGRERAHASTTCRRGPASKSHSASALSPTGRSRSGPSASGYPEANDQPLGR